MIANRIRMRKKSKGGGEPIETWDGIFSDPEVGRVLKSKGLIANANQSSIEELATITSLNPSGNWDTSYFYKNTRIKRFPELKYCTGLTDMIGIFAKCSNLTEVGNIPEGVTNMRSTFNCCSSLVTAPIISSSVTQMSYTFADGTRLNGIFIIKPINPPAHNDTFRNVNVRAIYVPDESVSTYKSAEGWSEFADKIYPMSDMEDMGYHIFFADPEVGKVLYNNGLIANANKTSKRELAFITSLNPGSKYDTGYFYNNKVITKFPELQYCTGLSSLYMALRGCSNLTEVGNIPEGVTNMHGTFNGCSSLVTAPIISSSVTQMSYTFADGTRLNGIFIIKPVTPPTYNDTFRSVNVVAIYVPDESVDSYKTAGGWSDYASKIYPMSESPK